MTDHDRLLQLAEFVADGVAIDWVAQREQLDPEDRRTLERLATLDRLNRAMRDPLTPSLPEVRSWGHLEILGRLGQGATSTVFRAFDPALNREVALKLRSARDAGGHAIRTWTDEAHRLARVRHPNVLAVHGAAVHDGIPGLWCELLCGQTLEPGRDRGPHDVPEVLRVAAALLEAVICVHDAGLVHGDIKPANVIREPDGRVVLMDFGAASEHAKGRVVADRAGTPIAMAPERFEGRPLTPAIDIFGVGVVLFVLLDGRYPVVGTTETAIRNRWRRGDRPHFNRRRIPRSLRRLVLVMLSGNPAERPDARAALRSVRRIQGALARRVRAAAVIGTIALLGGALAISLEALQTSRQAQRESEAVRGFLTDLLSAPRRTRLGPDVPMSSVLEDTARLAPIQLAHHPAALADVLVTIGESLLRLDRLEPARALFDQADGLYRSLDRPIDVARLRKARGDLARQEQAFERAEALYRENLEQLSAGPDATPIRVGSWIAVGQMTADRGDLESANAIFEQALAEARDIMGEHSETVALTRLALGQLALTQGRFEVALEALQAAVDSYLARSGARNRNVVIGRSGLVEALDRLGRLDQAYVLAQRNARVASEWLGPSDGLTVMSLDALANIESRRGQPERALEVSREALAGLRESDAVPRALILQFKSNQVGYLLDLDRPRDALALAERVLPEALETFEPGHSVIDVTSLNLADALLQLDRPTEALAVARDLHRRYSAQSGEDHLFALVAAYLAGGSLSALGEADEADAFLEASHAGLAAQLGEDNSLTLKAARLLGEHWLRTGRIERARALVGAARDRSKASLGVDHVRTRNLDELQRRLAEGVAREATE